MKCFSTSIFSLFGASKTPTDSLGPVSGGDAPIAGGHCPERAPMWLLRKELVRAVADCPEAIRQEMALSIHGAKSGVELWLLRSLIFQCIAVQYGQTEARRRINDLQPFFNEWEPQKL